jgi:heme exporter protein CcmD
MNEFLAMGGYARFVWPSYALTFLVVVLNVYWARRALSRARDEVRRRLSIVQEASP